MKTETITKDMNTAIMPNVDYNQLSEWGLIYKINKEILHPLGLAMTRTPNTGFSEGVLIAEDLTFTYDSDLIERNEIKYNKFIANRKEILSKILMRPNEITIRDVNDNISEYVICSECFAVNYDNNKDCHECGKELQEDLDSRNESDHTRSIVISRVAERVTSWIDMYAEDGADEETIWDCVVEV